MFARTKRLMLRPGWLEDAPALTEAIAHEPVVGMLARAPWPYALGDAEAYLSLPRSPHEPRFVIEALDGPAPRLVGTIALMRDGDAHELGYWLTPDAWGRGYATEAGRAVLHAARHALGLKRVVATHALDNPASARVLGKLGFRVIGETQRHYLARGTDVASALLECTLDVDEDRPAMPIAA